MNVKDIVLIRVRVEPDLYVYADAEAWDQAGWATRKAIVIGLLGEVLWDGEDGVLKWQEEDRIA